MSIGLGRWVLRAAAQHGSKPVVAAQQRRRSGNLIPDGGAPDRGVGYGQPRPTARPPAPVTAPPVRPPARPPAPVNTAPPKVYVDPASLYANMLGFQNPGAAADTLRGDGKYAGYDALGMLENAIRGSGELGATRARAEAEAILAQGSPEAIAAARAERYNTARQRAVDAMPTYGQLGFSGSATQAAANDYYDTVVRPNELGGYARSMLDALGPNSAWLADKKVPVTARFSWDEGGSDAYAPVPASWDPLGAGIAEGYEWAAGDYAPQGEQTYLNAIVPGITVPGGTRPEGPYEAVASTRHTWDAEDGGTWARAQDSAKVNLPALDRELDEWEKQALATWNPYVAAAEQIMATPQRDFDIAAATNIFGLDPNVAYGIVDPAWATGREEDFRDLESWNENGMPYNQYASMVEAADREAADLAEQRAADTAKATTDAMYQEAFNALRVDPRAIADEVDMEPDQVVDVMTSDSFMDAYATIQNMIDPETKTVNSDSEEDFVVAMRTLATVDPAAFRVMEKVLGNQWRVPGYDSYLWDS